jgi:TRAP-type C4-dicarboxylate transport system substrate-binding protein
LFPVTTIPAIPGAGFPDDTLEANTAHTNTFFELLDKFPAAAAEFEQFAPMFFYIVYSQSYLISKNKKVTVPTDLKGMKVGSSGLRMDFVSKFGSAPVTDMPPTAYEKLQTGVTDASFVAVSAAKDFKIYEVTNYILDVPFGGGGMPIIMNKNTWNKISPEDQQLMKELAVEGSRMSNEAIAENTRDAWQLLTDKGMKVTVTAEERALWDKEFAVLWEEYIQQNEAAGVTNAREIFNFWKAAADKAWGN